ncbi:hypothetical protein MTO96_033108 [Rhipicephalus appendiculatus]
MIYFVVVVSLLLGSSTSVLAARVQINEPGCGMPTRGMIVNGTIVEKNQFPWMVFLKLHTPDGEASCGGSILTKRHILTAAHCTHDGDVDLEKIEAFYGSNDKNRGKRLMVTKITRHPKYNPVTYPDDIAVLEVEKPFEYGSNARPICIPAAPMDIFDTEAITAGWGHLQEGGDSSDTLRYTTLRILPNELCSVLFFIKGYVSDSMLCAYRKGTDTCQGDSGGPLMSQVDGGRYVQVGVVSFGEGCARKYIPGVYMRVEAYIPWLMKVVGSFDKAYSSKVPLQLTSYDVPQWPYIFRFP